jgi:hypothetical protein
LQEAREEVEYHIHVCQLTLKDAPLLGQEVIAKRIKMTADLLNHISLLLEKKENILQLLKNSHPSGCITIEAPYHKYCYKVMTAIPNMVNNLSQHLDNLEWERTHTEQDVLTLADSKDADLRESLSLCEDVSRRYRKTWSWPE